MALKAKMPKEILCKEYKGNKLNDKEIAQKYNLTINWINKLRKIYGIKTDKRYQFHRNPLRHLNLTIYQKEVLHGSLMGDSMIATQASGTGYWKCTHCLAQKELLLKKAQILEPLISKIFYGKRPFKKEGKNFPFICSRSFALPQFTYYRTKFYPKRKKLITAKILSEITPVGFAYWWMDDGIKSKYGFNIVTYDKYFKNNKSNAIKIFKKFLDLSVSITWYKNEGNICILKNSHDKAWSYIQSEITNDLRYKLPKKYQ